MFHLDVSNGYTDMTLDKVPFTYHDSTITQDDNPLPIDLLLNIFSYLDNPIEYVLKCSSVCNLWHTLVIPSLPKESHEYSMSQQIWRTFTLNQWPSFFRKTKVSNWYILFKKRYIKVEQPNKHLHFFDEKYHPIENCDYMEFKCPIALEDELMVRIDHSTSYCNKCHKNVYHVNTMDQLYEHGNRGNCVAYKEEKDLDNEIVFGLPRRRQTTSQRVINICSFILYLPILLVQSYFRQ
jgi:hypothetical protein